MSTQIMDEALKKELEELRELHRQAVEQADLDKEEIAALKLTINTASIMSFTSPVANTNLLRTINAAVPIDERRLNDALNGISREFDGRLNNLHNILTNEATAREDRLLHNITALITSNISTLIFPNAAPISTVSQNISPNLPNVAPTSTVPQNISPNLPNVAPTSTAPQSFNLAASTSPATSWQRAQVHSLPYRPLIMITTNLSKSNRGRLSIQTRPRRRSDFG